MANNNAIFNAVLCGAGGANQERWITSQDSASYEVYRTAIEQIAIAVDALVEARDVTISEQLLMQAICQGIFANRFPQAANYSAIAGAIVALFTEMAAVLEPDPPVGSSFDPIQNVRWYDPNFVGIPNGSIASPWTTFADFNAELLGSSETGGWELTLPGTPITQDDPTPDLNNTVHVVYQGVEQTKTFVGTFFIFGQSGHCKFLFRDMSIVELNMLGGTYDYELENVNLEGTSVSGTLSSSIKLINCNVTSMDWGVDSLVNIEMHGGTLGGAVFGTGKFFNVQILDNATLVPGVGGGGVTSFVGCEFNDNITIDNANSPEVHFDPYSWSTFSQGVANAYTGNKRFMPVVLVTGTCQLTGTNPINPNTITTFDFGDPIGGAPLVEPGAKLTGSFPLGTGFPSASISAISCDGDTGHVMVAIANNSAATIIIEDTLDLNITYEPRSSA